MLDKGANNLRTIRNRQSISVWGVAARAKTSPSTITAIEKHNYVPTVTVREKIAAALGVTVTDVWPSGAAA